MAYTRFAEIIEAQGKQICNELTDNYIAPYKSIAGGRAVLSRCLSKFG